MARKAIGVAQLRFLYARIYVSYVQSEYKEGTKSKYLIFVLKNI